MCRSEVLKLSRVSVKLQTVVCHKPHQNRGEFIRKCTRCITDLSVWHPLLCSFSLIRGTLLVADSTLDVLPLWTDGLDGFGINAGGAEPEGVRLTEEKTTLPVAGDGDAGGAAADPELIRLRAFKQLGETSWVVPLFSLSSFRFFCKGTYGIYISCHAILRFLLPSHWL